MDLPRVTTVSGAYEYFLGALILLALAFGVYVLGYVFGVFPDPTAIW